MLKLLTGGAMLAALAFAGPAMADVSGTPQPGPVFGPCAKFNLVTAQGTLQFAMPNSDVATAVKWSRMIYAIDHSIPLNVAEGSGDGLPCHNADGTDFIFAVGVY